MDPSGRRVVYRKCHLFGDYERALFTPGETPPRAFGWGQLSLGMLICYDVEFPESVRKLARDGARLALVPTAQPQNRNSAFIAEKIVPVRAFENQIAIVYANHAGADQRFAYAGRSRIVMPDGSEAAVASASESIILVAEYYPEDYEEQETSIAYLSDLRRDLFEK